MSNDWGIAPMSYFGTQCAGHEGAGVIVKVGERVKRLVVGQRAGIKPIAETCGSCEQCIEGQDQYCASAKLTGFLTDGEYKYLVEIALNIHTHNISGTYKQYLRSPEAYTTIIPDDVPDYIAGPVMCSAATMYTSLKESGLRPGNWAVFPGGGGGVGIQGVQLASAMGIRPLVIDSGDKREFALEYGAEVFLDFKEGKNLTAEVVACCGGIGAHGVFVTAGESYPTALAYLGNRVGGKVRLVYLPSDLDSTNYSRSCVLPFPLWGCTLSQSVVLN
jgi:propanol-preferring alcohol dehydrogenase